MKCGSRLDEFASRFPDRFFDVGIAEGHMVTMAAEWPRGAEAGGFVYSTFLQRAMDQVVHDVCMQNLPVTFAVDRQALSARTARPTRDFSTSLVQACPQPCHDCSPDEEALRSLFLFAGKHEGPVMIRFPGVRPFPA